MIEEILPEQVVAVEMRHDVSDFALHPLEEATVGRAVEKRRREFTTARACAREAFARLGVPAQPLPSGEHGEPRWPAGVVGSITHCQGYRACVIARASEIVTLGIDAEPHAALPDGVLAQIALPEERSWMRAAASDLPGIHWDRVLFSAKESVYKAWFPLAQRWLGFEDALVTADPALAEFSARLLVPGPMLGSHRLTGFSGRWLIRDGLVLTAIGIDSAARP